MSHDVATAVDTATQAAAELPVVLDTKKSAELRQAFADAVRGSERDYLAEKIAAGEVAEQFIAIQVDAVRAADDATAAKMRLAARAAAIDSLSDAATCGKVEVSYLVRVYHLADFLPRITEAGKNGHVLSWRIVRQLLPLLDYDRATAAYSMSDDVAAEAAAIVRDLLSQSLAAGKIGERVRKAIGKAEPVKTTDKPDAAPESPAVAPEPVSDSLESWQALGQTADRAHIVAIVAGFAKSHAEEIGALFDQLAELAGTVEAQQPVAA